MAFDDHFDDLLADALDPGPQRRPLNVVPMVMVLVAAVTVAAASIVQLVAAGEERLAVGALPTSGRGSSGAVSTSVPADGAGVAERTPVASPAPVTIPLPSPERTPLVGPDEQRSGSLGAADLAVSETAPVPAPVALRLDARDIAAEVVAVGITDGQRLEIPPVDQVGWYRYGARPGEDGSAVLAAHVDYGGRAGAFVHLATAQAGDRIEVGFDDGTTRAFTVVAVRQYPKASLPVAELFSPDGGPSLALVTCGGAFDASARSYEDNVVVYAEPA
ncbi:MAG: class F sortase [Actinomycetota bacterium]|nr:class F sortase [Actinomycetota bacterium]